jgi:hypothetical protein
MPTIRHGDILLKPVKRPKKLKSIFKGNSFVIAEGETTGHRHLLVADREATVFEILEDEKGNRYLEMSGTAKISHEEHKTKTVLPDFYIIDREEEYDPFLEEMRKVQD